MRKIHLLSSLGLFIVALWVNAFAYATTLTPPGNKPTPIAITGQLNQYPSSYLAVAGVANLSTVEPNSIAILAGKANIAGHVNRLAIGAGDLTINATLQQRAILFAGTINALANTQLKKGGSIIGGQIHWAGRSDQDITIIGGKVSLSGQYHGNVNIITGQLTVLPQTKITGKLKYASASHANISSQAQITGGIVKNLPALNQQKSLKHISLGHFILQWAQLWLALIILAVCCPRLAAKVSHKLVSHPAASLGAGLLTVIAGFIVVPILIFTVIGNYVALLWALTYVLLLLLGYLYFAQSLGMLCLGKKSNKTAPILSFWTNALAALIGLAILMALALLPIVGKWLVLLLTVFGVGSLVLSCRNESGEC